MIKKILNKILPKKRANIKADCGITTTNGRPFVYSGTKTVGGSGDNYILDLDREVLIDRSELMFFLNPYAQIIFNRLTVAEINTGLILQPAPNQTLLELDLKSWNRLVSSYFNLYAEQTETIDFKKQMDFGQLQKKIRLESLIYGDCLVVNIPDQNGYTQLKIINSRQIRTPYTRPISDNIIDGVELDSNGRHRAFWVIDDRGKFKRIRAVNATTGRFQAKMVYCNEKRIGTRGCPILSPVLQDLHQLDQFKTATISKKMIEAKIVAVVESASELQSSTAFGLENQIDLTTGKTQDLSKPFADFGDSMIVDKLSPGTKLNEFARKEADLSFAQFEEAIFNVIVAALNLPPESARILFSSNYSASQASNVELAHYLDDFKSSFASQVLDPIYKDFLKVIAAKDFIPYSSMILDSLNSDLGFYAWSSCKWNRSKKAVGAFEKQVKALNMAVERGLMPWSVAASELTGMNPIDVIDMIQKDQDLLLSLRVPPEYLQKPEDLQKDPNEIIEVIE